MSGKSRGSAFEREVAELFSLWWTDGERDDIFYRSHSSGGRFTARKKGGKDTALQGGDITCTDPTGEPLVRAWNMELKTGYGTKTKSGLIRWDILDFIDSRQRTPILMNMWEQCKRDADLTGREPVLIFRRNNRLPCIMFTHKYYSKLIDYLGDSPPSITIEFFSSIELAVCSYKIISLDRFFVWAANLRSLMETNLI